MYLEGFETPSRDNNNNNNDDASNNGNINNNNYYYYYHSVVFEVFNSPQTAAEVSQLSLKHTYIKFG